MKETPQWSTQGDRLLKHLRHLGKTAEEMAARLGVSQEEIISRLEFLSKPTPPPLELPPVKESAEAESKMDGIELLFLEVCRKYSEMGVELTKMSAVLSLCVTQQQAVDTTASLERFYEKMVGEKQPFPEFLARTLHANFFMIPRHSVVEAKLPPPTS